MGLIEWLKKSFKRDIERMKRYPARYLSLFIFAGIGGVLIGVGWGFLKMPPPPPGYRYDWDPHMGGFIVMIVGFILIAICLLIYSTMKLENVT